MSSDDPQLKLAIELSLKSFAEDEKKRREGDLIRFDPVEDPQRVAKYDEIRRILSQSSFDGGRQRSECSTPFSTSVPSSSNVPPYPRSSYPTLEYRNTSFLPPLPTSVPPPRPPKSEAAARGSFPPNPSWDLFDSAPPPPLPPRRVPRQELTLPNQLTISQRTSSLPNNVRSHAPSIQQTAFDALSVGSSTPRTQSEIYSMVGSELYVPFKMMSTALVSGDLIDLGAPNDDVSCSTATMEQIRREFDPLYPNAIDARALTQMPAFSESHVNEPPTAVVNDEKKSRSRQNSIHYPTLEENKENSCDWSTIDCIVLQPCLPTNLVQIALLEERMELGDVCNSEYFTASTSTYPTTSAQSIKVIVSADFTMPRNSDISEIVRTVPTDSFVSMLLTEVLGNILSESEMANGVPVEKYALKVYGQDEFLRNDSELGHNIYVGDCLLHGKDVKLQVGVFEATKTKFADQASVPTWEKMKSQIRVSSMVDREDINNILLTLNSEMTNFERTFHQSASPLTVAAASNKVSQCVKALCTNMNFIEPVTLHRSLQKYLTATTTDQLQCSRNDLIAALHSFIRIFCQSTASRYKLDPLWHAPSVKKEIIECRHEKLKVLVNSLHNLTPEWMSYFQDFTITAEVYHGTEKIGFHEQCLLKNVKSDAFFPYVLYDVYIVFRSELCTCPRETKIMFILSAVPKQNLQTPDVAGQRQPLAYVSLPLFDHDMIMRQGQLFLPLTVLKEPTIKPWGPLPLISNEKEPILIVTLPTYDYQINFPNVNVPYESCQQDISKLPYDLHDELLSLIISGDAQKLTVDKKEKLWQKRAYLIPYPEALPFVLASVSDWGYVFLPSVYQALECWTPLPPVLAMQLLLPQFPDVRVRAKAVDWIASASSVFLFNNLPQLVEALRFEMFECSPLAVFLLSLSFINRQFAFEIYWQLQQRIDHCMDLSFAKRCSLLQKELLRQHETDHLREEIALQHCLLNELDSIQMDLRNEDSDVARLSLLRSRLGTLDASLLNEKVRLPCMPSFLCCGVVIEQCSIFNSKAKPLKIVFRGLEKTYSIILKSGDDMRQDAIVLQLVGMMDDIWRSKQLDLRMVTFRCMPVGYRKGMGQLVSDCATLLEIQKEAGGVTGVFKDDVLKNWLAKHNNTEFLYRRALDNFTRSCAGWCVVSYVFGIGDRHNDNILVTTDGLVFHIDFGKYMGDWQMAGGFRRDRVPFVFTPEMFHVINDGSQQSENYQKFIDYCCEALIALRERCSIILNVLRIMACSDIPGINADSLEFVEEHLFMELSDTEAITQFTDMINSSLNSISQRLNFFIHALAQKISSGSNFAKSNADALSFVPQLHTKDTDGKIKSVQVIQFEKRHVPHKLYLYKLRVERENEAVSSIIYRSFEEFNELYMKLRRRFSTIAFPPLSRGTQLRSNVLVVAEKRFYDLQYFIQYLFTLSPEVCHCDLVYTFFHIILRDNNMDSYTHEREERNQCQVFMKIQHSHLRNQLSIFVGHVKHLSILPTGQAPDSYVKTYIRSGPPHLQANTKRKTPVVKCSQNPTFNKELSYDLYDEGMLSSLVLEVSVWNSGGLMDNQRMYLTHIPLLKLKNQRVERGSRVLEGWFALPKSI